MSEKKFDKYYVDSNNVNRMKNILQFVNNCEFNNLKKAQSSQTKSSQMFSSLLKKYFNGEFKSSDLLTLKYFIDNYNQSVASYLFSPEVDGDESTKKPAFPLEKVFQIELKNGIAENTSTEYSCFYNRYENLRQHLLDLINIGKPDTPFIQIPYKIDIGSDVISVTSNKVKYNISRYFSINGINYYYHKTRLRTYLTDNVTDYDIDTDGDIEKVTINNVAYKFEGNGNSQSKLILIANNEIFYQMIVSASTGDTSYYVSYDTDSGKDKIIIENIYDVLNNKVTVNGTEYKAVDGKITINSISYPIQKKKTLDYLPDILYIIYSIKNVDQIADEHIYIKNIIQQTITNFNNFLKNVLLDNVFKNDEDANNSSISNFLTNFVMIDSGVTPSYSPTTGDTVQRDAIQILLVATLYYIISFILKQFIFSKSTIPSDTDKYYPLDAENFNVLQKIPVTPINVQFAITENVGRKRFSDGSRIQGLLIEEVFNTSDIVDIGGDYLKGEDFFQKYFTINSDKVIINNVEYTYSSEKLTDSDGNEYLINSGSVIINNIIYTVEVIINNIRYRYSPEKLIGSDGKEYPIDTVNGNVIINGVLYNNVRSINRKIISSKKYNIVNSKVTINNIEYIIDNNALKGNNYEFPIISNSVTIIDERLSYQILYKELNNYFRDASKTSIYESLVGILLLESKIYNKNVDLGVLLKNNTLYNSIMEINVLDTENYKYSLIFDMYFDKPAYRNSYKYFKSNHIYNNLAEDLDILGFISGDYAFSRGFGNGILLETSEDSIDLFIGEYDRCKDYFMTVLHNYAYSSEPGYRAYAFLKILSSAISAWNDNFQKNIYNTDFYTNSDIDSFLRTFGLENIAKNYLGLTDTQVKLKIIENYTKLMREKGTAEIITDLENLLSTETRTVSLKPVFISKYNDGISTDPFDRTKFKIEKDDSLIFVPALNGYNNLFNRIESYIDMGARPFNQVVDDDPYWDQNDISQSFLLKNFDLNMTPTKYLQYNIYVNSDFQKIIAQLLLSGADANINQYSGTGLTDDDEIRKIMQFKSYVRWSKEVAAIYEFITAIYITRYQKQISESYEFPQSLRNTSNPYDKQGYYSWYDSSDEKYLGFLIDADGTINVNTVLTKIKSSISIDLSNTAYANNPDYITYINLVKNYSEISSIGKADIDRYIKLIKDITTCISSIRGMLNSGILLADDSSVQNLIEKEEAIYSDIRTREYPITALYAGGDHTTLRLINDNIIGDNTISNSIINSIKDYIDIDLDVLNLNEDYLELIINNVASLTSDKFNAVILELDNLYTQVVMSIRSVFKEINLTSNYVDSINMIQEPMSFSESRDYYQVFTDILKNFLSYSIQLIGNAASSSDSKNYTDEYQISESYAILINTFVLLDKIPDIDEELIIYDESGEARVNVS